MTPGAASLPASAPSSSSPATENPSDLETDHELACTATLDGSRRCIRRGPHTMHRWESEDGAQRFDWG